MATEMDADSITVKSAAGLERMNARTKIWAAGVQASPLASVLAEAAGAETDRAGRVMVLPDCTLPGYPEGCSRSATWCRCASCLAWPSPRSKRDAPSAR